MANDKIKILPKALTELMGIQDNKVREDASSSTPVYADTYSRSEQNTFFRNTYVSNPKSGNSMMNTQGLMQVLQPVHEEIGRILYDMEKMKALAPEINQASVIRTSSIMSPNDLQEGVFKCKLDKIPGLEEEVKTAIAEYLTGFFNETINLGGKATDWLKQCLYGAGSTPIFIFPSTYFQEFRKDGLMNSTGTVAVSNTERSGVPGQESMEDRHIRIDKQNKIKDIYYSEKTFDAMWDKKILTDNKAGLESFEAYLTKKDRTQTLFVDTLSTLAELNPNIFQLTNEKEIPADLKPALEAMKVTLTKILEEGDKIKLSENPEIIKFAGEYQNFKKKKVDEQYIDKFQGNMYYHIQELVSVQKYMNNDSDEEELGHPFYMVLPPEAVVPIHVPGDPKTHLGYFILVDEFGHPLQAQDSSSGGCSGGSVNAAYNTMFGGSCSNKLGRYNKQMTNTLFDNLLDQYIKAKLNNMGMDSVSVDKANGIANVMLFRLLQHKRTGLVFVPPHLMTYLCFDYRKNGTGKSLLEDIYFILALRATFMVASVMAMANDSINHHNISLTFDEKITNYEQIMDMVANEFINKRKMQLSIDPTDISRNIARNALTISPKNMAGIQGFELEPTTQAGQSVKVDNDLMSTFDTMLVTALGVPYAALNQLSETEYSRSVVTGNLFFSKQIKKDQGILCNHMEHFARTFIMYSKPLKAGIVKILSNKGRVTDENNKQQINPVKDQGTLNNEQDTGVILAKIIEHLQFTLPIPNIAPDKAQYQELRDYIGTIDELANVIFSNELVGADDQRAQGMLGTIRAFWKKQNCEDIFNRLGGFNTLELPGMDELGLHQIQWAEFTQALNNFAQFMAATRKTFSEATTDGFGGDTNGFGGGMDDGMGGMDDGMGGMGGGQDGMDMGFDAGPPPMDNEPTPTSEPTSMEPQETEPEADPTTAF